MPDRTTAEERLERILYILPAAGRRKDGASLQELARELDVSESEIKEDVNTLIARDFYHPAGGATNLQLGWEPGRLKVWSGGPFQRPVRLGPREAAALALALRARATDSGEGDDDDAAPLALSRRLEGGLAVADVDLESSIKGIGRGGDAGGRGGVLGFVREAVQKRNRCRIRYLKPGDGEPEERVICPYTLVLAEGAWYVIGHCAAVGDMRVFRLDRVLGAEPAEGTFDLPTEFDPSDYLDSDGERVYHADEDLAVIVRYSAAVARWLAEREMYEETEDGGIIVRHRVADPGWLVRHVLQYGPDAEVVEPPEMRELVAEAALRVARRRTPA